MLVHVLPSAIDPLRTIRYRPRMKLGLKMNAADVVIMIGMLVNAIVIVLILWFYVF
jgi:hypothetical protein